MTHVQVFSDVLACLDTLSLDSAFIFKFSDVLECLDTLSLTVPLAVCFMASRSLRKSNILYLSIMKQMQLLS